ncbi:unnamed protein product [Haemonchus placei]|uniref:Secreted protein n=1 Tax=Haemonchus placei TaxID=6290 RepID=A0A0N4WZB6_HAEPC|nr:unnamed protein product [Haemonchus placei]
MVSLILCFAYFVHVFFSWMLCTYSDGCGFAIQSRHRACNNPTPSSGGQVCHGLAHQTSVCGTESCNGSHILRSLPQFHSVRGQLVPSI